MDVPDEVLVDEPLDPEVPLVLVPLVVSLVESPVVLVLLVVLLLEPPPPQPGSMVLAPIPASHASVRRRSIWRAIN